MCPLTPFVTLRVRVSINIGIAQERTVIRVIAVQKLKEHSIEVHNSHRPLDCLLDLWSFIGGRGIPSVPSSVIIFMFLFYRADRQRRIAIIIIMKMYIVQKYTEKMKNKNTHEMNELGLIGTHELNVFTAKTI